MTKRSRKKNNYNSSDSGNSVPTSSSSCKSNLNLGDYHNNIVPSFSPSSTSSLGYDDHFMAVKYQRLMRNLKTKQNLAIQEFLFLNFVENFHHSKSNNSKYLNDINTKLKKNYELNTIEICNKIEGIKFSIFDKLKDQENSFTSLALDCANFVLHIHCSLSLKEIFDIYKIYLNNKEAHNTHIENFRPGLSNFFRITELAFIHPFYEPKVDSNTSKKILTGSPVHLANEILNRTHLTESEQLWDDMKKNLEANILQQNLCNLTMKSVKKFEIDLEFMRIFYEIFKILCSYVSQYKIKTNKYFMEFVKRFKINDILLENILLNLEQLIMKASADLEFFTSSNFVSYCHIVQSLIFIGVIFSEERQKSTQKLERVKNIKFFF
jgi:hypothetical protein